MQSPSSRITYQNLNSMKANSGVKPGFGKQLQLVIEGLLSDVSSFLGFVASKSTKNNMCKYNGHVVNKKSWTGRYPTCEECGCEVTDSVHLRMTNPRLAGFSTRHLNREYWVA